MICFISACKKKAAESKSPFDTQLPKEAVVSVTEKAIETSSITQLNTNQQPSTTMEQTESASQVIETNDYIAPTPLQIQEALNKAGYYKGQIDGIIGAKSKEAIKNFQKDNGLVADGKVGPKTWSKLKQYLNKETESHD